MAVRRRGVGQLSVLRAAPRPHVPFHQHLHEGASTTGLSIIRPQVLPAQADHNTFGVEHAYRFGNEFLVAPMLAPNATSCAVYLPVGNWLDLWTNVRHA